jgi:hypothetical protein
MVEALIKAMVVKFEPSSSLGVVGYVMYLEMMPNLVTRGSIKIFLGIPPIDPADGKMYVNLAELENIPTTDGHYNIGISAFDDSSNESAFSKADNVPLSFDAPDAPGDLTFGNIAPA